jgi:hypothetical protein
MATIKEWIRDFRKKPKWDQFCIVFTVITGTLGLIYSGNYLSNIYLNSNVENPTFNVQNSSKFGLNYNSPNSPITITETMLISETCGGSVYTKKISFNLSDFFSKPFSCESGTNTGVLNLKYDLFNVKFTLPTNQELFISRMYANESYIIAYMNEDFSDACIPHKYQITPEFTEDEVCFNIIVRDNVCNDPITIIAGPLFKTKKDGCYKMISGDSDFLASWNPN